ncbi:MAG TPA: hypothetical protein PK812_05240 [Beijerinckiaceae bacterium]|nr:hypothetical protein [Beijerinckiaceae bacterium]
MIEAIMYLAIGALLAGLLAIALLPALWRRAERLSRQRLMATLPVTPNEMAAEKDQIRAAAAVEVRRLEVRLDATDALVQQARKEIGDHVATIQQREATIGERNASIAALQADLVARHEDIAALNQRYHALRNERDNLVTNLDATRLFNQELDQESLTQRQLAEQRLARLAELERQLATLTEKTSEQQAVIAALRDDLRARTSDLRATMQGLRETTAQKSLAERRLAAAEALGEERGAQIAQLQAERLRQIDEIGQITRERNSERVEREARDNEIARLNTRIAETESYAARAQLAHQEVVQDMTATIEALRQQKRQGDAEIAAVRRDKARAETQITQRRARSPRQRKTPAE